MSNIAYSVSLDAGKFTSAIGLMRKGIGSVGSAFAGLGRMLPIGALIGGLGGVAGALALLKKSSSIAADFESTSIAMRVLIGDAATTKQVLDQVVALAEQTPFEFPELAESTKMLLAFNESTKTVVGTMRRIGDISSGIQAPIRDIAELYGKARVQGTLFAEDINQMTGRGIPIIQEFAKILGRSDGEIKKLASDGKITFPLLEQAFINLTSEGGKFYNMMAEQSQSTNGLLSTLTDGWNKLLRLVGTELNDWLRPQLAGWITNIDAAGVRLSALFALLRGAQQSGNLMEFVGTGLTLAFQNAINVFSAGLRGAVAYLGAVVPGIFKSAALALVDSGMILVLKEAFRGIGESFSAQIMRALGLSESADAAQYNADNAFANLPRMLSALRLDKGIGSAAAAIREAFLDGEQAWKSAESKALIDTSASKQRLADLGDLIDPAAYSELLTGESNKAKAMIESTTRANGLAAALGKMGDTAKVTAKKVGKEFQATMEEAPKRGRSYLKRAGEFEPGRFNGSRSTVRKFVPGPDGIFIPASADVANKGRNAFGKNRPPAAAENKAPAIDPLTRIWTEIKETNRRLGELGLA